MSVYIVKRDTKKGRRWHVRYQEGRYAPVVFLGSFDTERRAKLRMERAKDEVAQGRKPTRYAIEAEADTATLAEAGAAWLETLNDIADGTRRYYTRSVNTLPDELATKNPHAVTYVDVQAWVKQLSKRYARGTIDRELTVLRMLLDNAGVRDNPASDKRVRLPRKQQKIHRLPSRSELATLRRILHTREGLLLLLEHTGLRIHEAAALRWEDIDYERDRLFVAKSKTPAGRRFVERLDGDPPYPDRKGAEASALVFSSPGAMSLSNVLREAHAKKGAPLYSAHDFRHLHASRLLHHRILSPAEIAARLGHASPAITLSIYSHVVPPD